MRYPFRHRSLQMCDAFRSGSRHRRRHGSREDKARSRAADRVADHGIGGNIAPDDTETFCQGSFDDGDPVHDPVALGDAGSAQAVKTNRVHFVEISERIICCRSLVSG
jgi:hypothetical protein